MTPWILLPVFVLVVLAMTIEIPEEYLEDKPDTKCTIHQWSKDITNNELVCMGCNKRASEDV